MTVRRTQAAKPGLARQAQPQPPVAALRVLCVDDHAVLVEGLKAYFGIEGRIEVVGRLSNAARLAEEVNRLHPDAVLLDIEMPGPDAFAVARDLHRSHRSVRVIFLSAHIRDAYIAAAYSAGASAYFAKSDDLEAIAGGIKQVLQDRAGTFLLGPQVQKLCRAPECSRRVQEGSPETPKTLLSTLTPRELEVLRLIGRGRSRMAIASELCRSVKTVDGHQERILKKLGARSRADLMRLAIREGLAEA